MALLVELDGFANGGDVVVLAATNAASVLDSALTRSGRFDRVLHVPPPDIGGRKRLLRRLGEKIKLDDAAREHLDTLAGDTAGLTVRALPLS